MNTRPLAVGGPNVSAICVGASPLGGKTADYGYHVDESRAIATVRRVLDSPVRFLDTSNQYSDGESERRIGKAIREAGGLPDDFVIATKADPIRGGTFDGERVRQSFHESTERIGVRRFGVYYLHDPERFDFDTMVRPGGAVEAMARLKSDGLVDSIGVAGGDIDEMRRYVDTGVFDILLNHSRYTLLDQSADSLIDHAIGSGTTFVNAAPYASGILAKPAAANPRYQYRPPNAEIVSRTETLRAVCARYDIPLSAVALQFSTRDSRISSTVVGVSAPQRVDELVTNESIAIPQGLWEDVWTILALDAREAAAFSSRDH